MNYKDTFVLKGHVFFKFAKCILMLSYTNDITDLNKSLRIDERTLIHQFISKILLKGTTPF